MATSLNKKIASKQNTSSPIWTYFGLDDDGKPISIERVVCRICECTIVAKASNTTNLFSHLKSHHSVKYSEVTQAVAARKPSSSKQKSPSGVQPTLVDMVEKSKQYQKNGKKWQALTDSVTKSICKDMMPIYTVEKEGFQDMLHTFNSLYTLPGR